MESTQQAIGRASIDDSCALQAHILRSLHRDGDLGTVFPRQAGNGPASSTVMLLLSRQSTGEGKAPEICVILNKRSRRVRQAGDLCCPGGTVEPTLDPYLGRLLLLPLSPLTNWPYWERLHRELPRKARLLALLLATGLRESWEEMRLNPFSVRFLGVLPSQRLLLFHRIIHPMVGWVSYQKRFVPSWEVEKIVRIPLRALLRPECYARYRLYVPEELEKEYGRGTQDFSCFIHQEKGQSEILWGATFKIVASFLETAVGFKPPETAALPVAPGILTQSYIFGCEGNGRSGNPTRGRDHDRGR